MGKLVNELKYRVNNIRINASRFNKRMDGLGTKISKSLILVDKVLSQVSEVGGVSSKKKKRSYDKEFVV